MKDNNVLSIKEATEVYDSLQDNITRKSVKATLSHMNQVCSKMVDLNVTPSVPSVVRALANKGVMISEQTIYNKRHGKNPYPILIDAWIKVALGKRLNLDRVIKSSTEAKLYDGIQKTGTTGLITDEDLLKINDPVLRYKVSVLFGQVASLKKQNSVLRELRELPVIHPEQQIPPPEEKSQLDKYDIEILNNFSNNRGSRGLEFDETGALSAITSIRRGTILSEPGLKQAIEIALNQKSLKP